MAFQLDSVSEQQFQILANSIPQLAWMADAEGYIFWYNERWFDYTGTTLQEMEGWGWQKVHHPDEVGRVVDRIKHAFITGEVWDDTFPLRGKSGEYRWFLSRAMPIRDESGRVVRWFGTNTDVTEQREMEQALRRNREELEERVTRRTTELSRANEILESVLSNMSEAVIVADREENFLVFNPAAQRMFGTETPHITSEQWAGEYGLYLRDKRTPFPHDQLPLTRAICGEETNDVEMFVRRAKGEHGLWILVSGRPLRDARGERSGGVIVCRDITQIKEEEVLRAGQSHVLEKIATGAPLVEVLESLVLLMESQAEGLRCSILLLDADGTHLRHGAAPSLPRAYVEAIDGAAIGPRAGSCGTAMFSRRPVVVTDVRTDPLWADYRDLAESAGLRACWSTPIFSGHGEVLGSFAMYREESRGPRPEETRLTAIATHLAGIAIERKRAEEALRFSEEQLSLLQTITMQVAAAKDLSSALQVVLRRMCEKTGWVLGQSWLPRRDGTVLELGPVWMADTAGLENFPFVSKNIPFGPGVGLPGRVWKSKHPIWVEDVTREANFPRASTATECGLKAALAIPILARDEVIAVIEFFLRAPRHEDARLVDVAAAVAAQLGLAIERKRAEEAVREREARISVAAESADLALWVVYPEPTTAWMSEKGRTIYGFRPDEMLTRDALINRVHPDDRSAVQSVFDRACSHFEAFESEHRLLLPFGGTLWVIMRGRCLQDEEGKLSEVIGVSIDISAQKQSDLELQNQREQLAHLNRVALMGEMTASVAHELNQPLAAISSNAAAARRFLERGIIDPNFLREVFRDMAADSQRAGEVIHGIRRLVRKEESVRTILNLNAIVADTLRLLGSAIVARDSAVTTDIDRSLPPVEAVLVQMQQVLLNLIMNALDAVASLPPPQRRIMISTRSIEGTAEVNVRDAGLGLPKDHPEKVFERFFSTKDGGMGMGLTIVRSIIEAHSGTIGAENAPGGGARFFFRIPAVRPREESRGA